MKARRFFLVGAPKAGTTSVYHYLKQNDQIFLPEVKELHFFSFPEVVDTYYEVPFVSTQEEYESHFVGASDGQIVGDICPSYLYSASAAKRIFDFDANAKIVILLRNPIDRAISHYFMDVRQGYQTRELMEVLEAPRLHRLFYKEYVNVSQYYSQVKRYLDIFGKDSVLILDFDEFVSDLMAGLTKIESFLGLESHFDYDLQTRHNVYSMPRSKRIVHFIRQNSLLRALAARVPQEAKDLIKRGLYDKNHKKPSYTREKSLLLELFRADIVALKDIVDFDTGKWISKYGSSTKSVGG